MRELVVTFQQSAKRLSLGLLAVLVTLISSGLLIPGAASAAQVTTRSITMSTSAPSATAVTYTVTFTPGTTITHPDVLLDFCSNDPIIGDACTATAGTDTPNMSSAAATGYTVTTIGSNRGIKLTTSTLTYTSGSPVTITVTGVVNPSNTATFYGRLLTYTTGGAGAQTSVTASGFQDYGGIALSTTANILITSKVFETLAFCVFQTSCGTQANLTLGDPTTQALSTATAYDNSNAQYTIATNAQGGVNITMTGTTLCRSATPSNCNTGTTSIFTITSIGSTPLVRNPGSEQFGLCVDITGASGLTVGTAYIDAINNCHSLGTGTYAGTSKFGLNDSTSAGGTNNAAGSQVLSSTVPIASYTGVFTFLGDIAATTEAGVYTTSLNLVATGTF